MHKFVRNLITEWRRLELPFSGETLVVAVSGGADSVSLLLAVSDLVNRIKLEHKIIVAHFNHGLRDDSDADEVFVAELAKSLGVEFISGRGKVSRKGNLEQNARDARYEFLETFAEKTDAFAVLTGHTINDQAETFLLNLIRGSGAEGLSGMPAIRRFEDNKRRKREVGQDFGEVPASSPILIRPLLLWAKRNETESFCRDSGINFRMDAMNEDFAFKRVRIRKELIPMLEQLNPKIIETLADTSKLMRQTFSQSTFEPKISDELWLNDLKTLSENELFQTLRAWLRQQRGNLRGLGLKHIRAIVNLTFSEKSGRVAELPGGNVVRSSGKLVYQKN